MEASGAARRRSAQPSASYYAHMAAAGESSAFLRDIENVGGPARRRVRPQPMLRLRMVAACLYRTCRRHRRSTCRRRQQDVRHTFPAHPWLQTPDGQACLRRVLCAYSVHNESVGYCRSMNNIAALMLVALNRRCQRAPPFLLHSSWPAAAAAPAALPLPRAALLPPPPTIANAPDDALEGLPAPHTTRESGRVTSCTPRQPGCCLACAVVAAARRARSGCWRH